MPSSRWSMQNKINSVFIDILPLFCGLQGVGIGVGCHAVVCVFVSFGVCMFLSICILRAEIERTWSM